MVLQTIALPLGDRATGLEEFQTAKEGDRDSFAAQFPALYYKLLPFDRAGGASPAPCSKTARRRRRPLQMPREDSPYENWLDLVTGLKTRQYNKLAGGGRQPWLGGAGIVDDGGADEIAPFGPGTVVVADLVEAEEILQNEPGVGAALADAAVGDNFV